jgi:hypothetical protein
MTRFNFTDDAIGSHTNGDDVVISNGSSVAGLPSSGALFYFKDYNSTHNYTSLCASTNGPVILSFPNTADNTNYPSDVDTKIQITTSPVDSSGNSVFNLAINAAPADALAVWNLINNSGRCPFVIRGAAVGVLAYNTIYYMKKTTGEHSASIASVSEGVRKIAGFVWVSRTSEGPPIKP